MRVLSWLGWVEVNIELLIGFRGQSVGCMRKELETVMLSSVELDCGWHLSIILQHYFHLAGLAYSQPRELQHWSPFIQIGQRVLQFQSGEYSISSEVEEQPVSLGLSSTWSTTASNMPA